MTTATGKKPKKAAATRPAAPGGETGGPDADEELDQYSDRLLAEVPVAALPPMREFHQLNRRSRAQLTRAVTDLLPRLAPLEQAIAAGADSDTLATTSPAEIMELLADVEDLLALIAIDAGSFRIWAQTAEDRHLLAAFLRFVRTFDSGEASSSSS